MADEDLSTLFTPAPPEDLSTLFRPAAWTAEAYVDGGCRGNPGPAGYGVYILWQGRTLSLKGTIARATNNEAEYHALLACLRWAQPRIQDLHVFSDSQVVVRQVQGRYGVSSGLRPLYLEACALVRTIQHFTITHVPREQNRQADRLATEAMDEAGFPRPPRPMPAWGSPPQGVAPAPFNTPRRPWRNR